MSLRSPSLSFIKHLKPHKSAGGDKQRLLQSDRDIAQADKPKRKCETEEQLAPSPTPLPSLPKVDADVQPVLSHSRVPDGNAPAVIEVTVHIETGPHSVKTGVVTQPTDDGGTTSGQSCDRRPDGDRTSSKSIILDDLSSNDQDLLHNTDTHIHATKYTRLRHSKDSKTINNKKKKVKKRAIRTLRTSWKWLKRGLISMNVMAHVVPFPMGGTTELFPQK